MVAAWRHERGWVYIMTNRPYGTLLSRRDRQYRAPGLGKHREGVSRRVYEAVRPQAARLRARNQAHDDIRAAIQREKDHARTGRAHGRSNLILRQNPDWNDLYETLPVSCRRPEPLPGHAPVSSRPSLHGFVMPVPTSSCPSPHRHAGTCSGHPCGRQRNKPRKCDARNKSGHDEERHEGKRGQASTRARFRPAFREKPNAIRTFSVPGPGLDFRPYGVE